MVDVVGLRPSEGLTVRQLLPPVLTSRGIGAHEVVVEDRSSGVPHALGSPIVGYAALASRCPHR